MNDKKQEIKKIINNPIIPKMQPGQKALKSAFSKPGTQKVSPNQITITMDKREKKLGNQKKPKN